MTIRQVLAPFLDGDGLGRIQEMVLASIESAPRGNWSGLLCPNRPYQRPGWSCQQPHRDARSLGDSSDKPFILDLLDRAAEGSQDEDWLLLTNSDCLIHPALYSDLRNYRGCAVELMRQDVEQLPQGSLPWDLASTPLEDGLDGLALRTGFFRDIRSSLPDFVLGEPWWDPCLSWLLRSLVPVRRWTGRLFHERHPQRWSPSEPGAAGRHNLGLATRAAELGLIPQLALGPDTDASDTAVIVVNFGSEPRRRQSLCQALEQQLQQDLDCTTYVLDLLPDEADVGIPPDLLDRICYQRWSLTSEYRYLFLKESLFNAAWQWARQDRDYQYYLFLDADIYSPSCNWLRHLRERLRQDPNRAVQGYRSISDPQDPNFAYSSVAAYYALQEQSDLPMNPGLCWGLHRSILEAGAGFNPWCPEGAGDSAFVIEYLSYPDQSYEPSLLEFRWYSEIFRALPFRAAIDAIPFDLLHAYHGPTELRQRQQLREHLDRLPPLRESLELDDRGILRWKSCSGPHYEALKSWVETGEVADFRPQRQPRPRLELRHRPLPGLPRAIPITKPEAAGEAADRSLVLFRPRVMNRSEHPWSWCGNAKTSDDQQRIPVEHNGSTYQLVLQPLKSASWMQAVLPIHPSWGPVNLLNYQELSGRVSLADIDASLRLVWLDEHQQEQQEPELWLSTFLQGSNLRLPPASLWTQSVAARRTRSLLWTFYLRKDKSEPTGVRLWDVVLSKGR